MENTIGYEIIKMLHNKMRNPKSKRVGTTLNLIQMSNSKSSGKPASSPKPSTAPKPNPNYPSTTGKPSGPNRGNVPKSK